jgi:hypothetical protein
MLLSKKLSLFLSITAATLFIALILWLNYQIIWNWFGKNGPADLGSIEVSYVSMGRFITEFGFQTWIPFWYFGFPFHLLYTPLLPFLEAILHKFYGIPLWQTYRLITGVGFLLAPVSVFFLGWQLSKRVIGGAIAGILFTVSPFHPEFLEPQRFGILPRWGEGPHTLSLMFIPLVGLFFARYLEKKKFIWVLLTSICLGLAGLSNALGLFSSILLIAVMTFVKLAQDPTCRKQTMIAGLSTGLLALGLISFWYNFSFIQNFFSEGGKTNKLILSLFPWGWIIGILLFCLLYFLISKFIRHFAFATLLLWFIIFSTVIYVYNSTGTIEILPQAIRYTVEMDMSLSLLMGISFVAIIDMLAKRLRIISIIGNVIGVVLILGLIRYILPFFPVAQARESVVDIYNTGEYAIASWLQSHIDQAKGERVFLPGNYGFYLNWFTNVSQQRGGLYQAEINPWPDHMYYQMATGSDPAIAYAWLTIANIKYAVITGSGTREIYNEIRNPDRFSNYSVVYNNQGDTIYEVPLKRPSLAKPINLSKMQVLQIPKKGDDKALLSYADWVENSSSNTTELTMLNNDTYHIKGTVGNGEGILVQMAYHAGWHAIDNIGGKGINIQADPMKFLVLYPPIGKVDITLTHGRIWQEWLGYLVSFVTVVFVLLYSILRKNNRITT